MEAFSNLVLGFEAAATLTNLGFCLAGVFLGTLIGVLPGIGPVTTIALLLPLTYSLGPLPALIMLAGIYYGAQYGGSTTAILLNIPGESSSVVTCIDGYQMARKGRAGSALTIAAFGSFVAGSVGIIVLSVFSSVLAQFAQEFRAAEYFSLLVFGLAAAVVLAHGSVLTAIGMVLFGILLGMIGSDLQTGVMRYTFGIFDLYDGLDFVPVAIGAFGIAELMRNLENPPSESQKIANIGPLLPTREEFRRSLPAILRGSVIGSILGILPGGGAILSSYASYVAEKKISPNPQEFGHGAIEGLAGPEAANNAGAQTSFIPLLSLGLPSNPIMALMVGAMMIQGISPGTAIVDEQPALFWGLVASMWLGNLMLVVINVPLVGLWVKLLQVPYRIMFPCIIVICCVGTYSVASSTTLLWIMAIFAIGGYLLGKMGAELAPMLLGFMLGPLMEQNFRRAMALSEGNPMTFFTSPISCALLLAAFGLISLILVPQITRGREKAFSE